MSHVALADWPQFRGPNSSGMANGPSPPIEFGPGKNELWRVPMGSGHSSPCIVGGSIFLTTYDETMKQLAVVCLDRSSGETRWIRNMPTEQIEKGHPSFNPASSTPTSDGQRVVAYFGSFGLICFDMEGRIALRSNDENNAVGSAGLLFRVTCSEREDAELSGYEVAFDRNELVLNKQTDGKRQRLATYDLTKLENQPRMNEWNLLRIAADGARIRVWFNRMHPSSDPERGLRIDYTDKNDSVLSGAIGIAAHNVQAWYDDIVVLPIVALRQSRSGDRQ